MFSCSDSVPEQPLQHLHRPDAVADETTKKVFVDMRIVLRDRAHDSVYSSF